MGFVSDIQNVELHDGVAEDEKLCKAIRVTQRIFSFALSALYFFPKAKGVVKFAEGLIMPLLKSYLTANCGDTNRQ